MDEHFLTRARSMLARADWWMIFKIGLALFLFGAVLSQLEWQALVALWQRMRLIWLVPVFVLFCAILWAMAWRSWVLIGRAIPFRSFLSVVILQTVLTNVFSLVAGMAYFVALLRARYQVELRRGFGVLILMRWGDLLFWLPVLLVTAWWARNDLSAIMQSVLALCLLLTLLVLTVPCFIALRNGLSTLVRPVLTPFSRRGGDKLLAQFDAFAVTDRAEIERLLRAVIVTSLWVGLVTVAYIYAHAQLFAIPLPLAAIVFVTVVGLLISYLPIQVLGGLGVYEFSTVYLYGLFGLSASEAIPIVLGTRVLLLVMNALTLVYVLLETRARKKIEASVLSETRTPVNERNGAA